MRTEAVLAQLLEHNPAVLAAAAVHGDTTYRSTTGAYAMADFETIAHRLHGLFDLMAQTDDPGETAETVYLEFEYHGVLALQVDEAILLTITKPLMAAGLEKLSVGLGIYRKPLRRSLAEAASEPTAPPSTGRTERKKRRFYRGIPIED